MIKVFVYGSLMRGGIFSGVLKTSKLLGKTKTVNKYLMKSLGTYPALIDTTEATEFHPLHKVKGEVHEISRDILMALDYIESNGFFYQRKEIATEKFGSAWAYFLKDENVSATNNAPLAPVVLNTYDWSVYLKEVKNEHETA